MQTASSAMRVVAGSYFFKPNHIVVKVNMPVEILASREAGHDAA